MTKKISKVIIFPFKLLFSRATLAFISVLVQLGIIFLVYLFFKDYFVLLVGGMTAFSLILVVFIINSRMASEFKTSWIILVLALPGIGAFFYLFCKSEVTVKSLKRRLDFFKMENYKYLSQNETVMSDLEKKNKSLYLHMNYLYKEGHNPTYYNEEATYFPCGEEFYPDLLKELQKAQKFIFLEFFIIANDEMWQGILDILKKKAKEGVEVRVLYDGTCSFMLLPKNYPEILKEYGIKCEIFSPVVPLVSTHYNNRDHRKIIVIDGDIAYTGGINLASEYINKIKRFGYWKDNMLKVKGSVVNSLTVLFLESWNLMNFTKREDYTPYIKRHMAKKQDGFINFYGVSPTNVVSTGKMSYLYLIQTAVKTLDIAMPYFIVDNEIIGSLIYASKKGVKVRIILPGIPDKKLINYVAKTYYKELIKENIEIYEYKDGFTHLKMMLKDGTEVIVGTVNLDYRSLYLHFEDAILMYKTKAIIKMNDDYHDMIEKSHLVSLEECKNYSKVKLLIGQILRIFGPLL